MELVDFQYDSSLKDKFTNSLLIDFCKNYVSQEKCLGIYKYVVFIFLLFGSTYLCEQAFFIMKYIKSPERSLLFDSHLQDSLCVATITFELNILRLVYNQQCQVSH